jgi:acetylornithine deacetylase
MSLDPKLGSTLLESVDQGFADQLAFTQTMMRFPSLRGAEHAVQDFVFQTLRARGYALDRFEMDEAALQRHEGAGLYSALHSRAPIVVGIHKPRNETGRSLILQAHVDVVPPRTCRHVDTPAV